MSDQNHPALVPCRLLTNNIDLIGHAIKHQHGIIDCTYDIENKIESLAKAGLGYRDLDGFIIQSNVLRFVSHFDRRGRIKNSPGQIASLIIRIEECAHSYAFSKQRNYEDAKYDQGELIDALLELSNVLVEDYIHFSSQVHEKLLIISDLEVRIRANEKAIQDLKPLSDIMIQLSPDKLAQLGVGDKEIERLITKRLTPIVFKCHKELINAGHVLNEYLLRWKKDLEIQKRNSMIDAVHSFLASKQLSSILDQSTAPSPFFRVYKPQFTAYADLGLYRAQETLELIARKASENREKITKEAEKEIVEVEIQIDAEVLVEPSALEVASNHFFEALMHPQGPVELTAVQCYQDLKPEVEINSWILHLVSSYRDNYEYYAGVLDMHFIENIIPNYNGNRLVHDVVIKRI
ncbi:hypothetical protein F967_02229 [Acinetobacter sp. CIP 102637]|uniref:hypothetical protein n=1 Tax=Acinetobacter sp. CIP 102637 TaxID=1144669 RepID=UPI0002CDCA23|nr:hypothetical protein [Acinetobacter sp. CIP 102637]ENV05476.1 hypothetical protein F967_02229 [Acinetobacter sp. CIP 102637]